jgi:membrane protein YqaA with SNARE-associated domain
VARVTESLQSSLGLYGAALVIGFLAGILPFATIEVFLAGMAVRGESVAMLAVLIVLGVVGHQIAKTFTYYAGMGMFALPRGRLGARIEAAKVRIDRWNKRPRFIMFVAAATGLPPLYVLGFFAGSLMRMSITTFTVIIVVGRILRYATIVAIAGLF